MAEEEQPRAPDPSPGPGPGPAPGSDPTLGPGPGAGHGGTVAYYDNDFEWADLAATCKPILDAIPVVAASPSAEPGGGGGGAGEGGEEDDAWERFYRQHSRQGAVYSARRYLPLAFPELTAAASMVLLEVGCGLGSSLEVILACNPSIRCFACDVSPTALQLLDTKLGQHADRVVAFRCDAAREAEVLRANVPAGQVDLALLVFVLSAVDPRQHVTLLRNLQAVLRSGSGMLLFRDYGLHDMTQLRATRRLSDRLFQRQDGTLAFYFTPEYLTALLEECGGGWEIVECRYACVRNVNRATKQTLHRVFLHAKIRFMGRTAAPQERKEEEEEKR